MADDRGFDDELQSDSSESVEWEEVCTVEAGTFCGLLFKIL